MKIYAFMKEFLITFRLELITTLFGNYFIKGSRSEN
jgi:hypothetical protein